MDTVFRIKNTVYPMQIVSMVARLPFKSEVYSLIKR